MKSNKRSNQSRWIDYLIAGIVSLLTCYAAIAFMQTIGTDISFLNSMQQFNGKLEWIRNKEINYISPLLVVTVGVFVLLVYMTRKKEGGYKDASGHGAHGNAQFSSLDKLRQVGFIADKKVSKWSEKDPLVTLGASEGIILGRNEGELVIIPPDSKLDNRNVLLVGSSGSAKGQAFVINNIINNLSSTVVVTDPKGELFDLTADIKRDQGFNVHQIDFLNLKGSRYNPLHYVTNSIEAMKLANTISMNSAKDVKQDFFFNTARDLLAGLIIFAKSKYENPNISKTVKGLFNDISSDENFLTELCDEIGIDHPAYQYLKDASAATGNTRTSILSSFAQQTGVFSLQEVAHLTELNDFTFDQLQDHKSILYVKIPVKDNPVPALTATFFDQLITRLYDIGDKHGAKLKIPTILLFDEFANIGKLNDYDNTLSTCRGYDMSIITVVQDFAQLEAKYGKELSRTIINNHDTTLFLRTRDVETAKYFERIAGDTTIKFNTNSSSNGGGLFYLLGLSNASSSKSVSEQYIKKPLIAEGELLNMNPADKCYIFVTGHVLELKKAYQSMIYKGFITGTKKELINGVNTFPYTYPNNRDAYIKKFKLKPVSIEKAEHVEVEAPTEDNEVVSNVIVDSKTTNTQKDQKENESVELTQEHSKNQLDSLIFNFMNSISEKENKSSVENEQEILPDIDTSKSITPDEARGHLTDFIEEIQTDIENQEIIVKSDISALEMLNDAALVVRRNTYEAEKFVEEIVSLNELQSNFFLDGNDTSTKEKQDTVDQEEIKNNDEESVLDELPM